MLAESFLSEIMLSRITQPNQSPEPTPIGAGRSALAVHVTQAWLSFGR
jgi:hypothetical protein